MASEDWKPVGGFKNYEVSSGGRIRNVAGGQGAKKGGIVKGAANDRGYQVVALRRDGATSSQHVHTLVARAFLTGGAKGKTVQHRDHNRMNNRSSNLEWADASANYGEGRLSPKKTKVVKRLLAKGWDVRKVSKAADVAPGVVSLIKRQTK